MILNYVKSLFFSIIFIEICKKAKSVPLDVINLNLYIDDFSLNSKHEYYRDDRILLREKSSCKEKDILSTEKYGGSQSDAYCNVNTEDECEMECENRSKCQNFSWYATAKECYLAYNKEEANNTEEIFESKNGYNMHEPNRDWNTYRQKSEYMDINELNKRAYISEPNGAEYIYAPKRYVESDKQDEDMSPRVVKIKGYLDELFVADYKEKLGNKYKEIATNYIKETLKWASKYLLQLDAGGYTLELDGNVSLLSESHFQIKNIYRDRDNEIKSFNKKFQTFDYALAFQDVIGNLKNHQQSSDTILIIFTNYGSNREPNAAVEENCLCENHIPFPCVGVFGFAVEPTYKYSGMLLAHEIGHALGATEHDTGYLTIMSLTANGGVWSQSSKEAIAKQDNSCLEISTKLIENVDLENFSEINMMQKPSGKIIKGIGGEDRLSAIVLKNKLY